MAKVYFATKEDLTNEVNTLNESIDAVQSDLDSFKGTTVTEEKLNTVKSELSARIDSIEENINGSSSAFKLGPALNVKISNLQNACQISWGDPEDIVLNGATLAKWSGTAIVRKVGSAPTSKSDGTLILDSKTRDGYRSTGFKDSNLTTGVEYFYGIFPYTTDNAYNTETVVSIVARDAEVYQFTINQAESNPSSMITYGGDNASYTPAKMNYSTGNFDYGSWADAFFIRNLKPVVLGYDGSIVAELNPDDYTKKLDGTSAGITSTSLNGNVMVGIPKTYIKTVTSGDKTTVYIADTKLDDDYHCYAHIDYNEQEQDYAYMSAYEGYTVSNKMRSISGQAPTVNTTADAEVTAAVANNTNTSIKRWYVETYSMRCLLIYLLMLISRSTDNQTAFGKGRSASSNSSAINTGTMNTKGLFWGSTDGTSGVKVFGIENFWGNIYNRITGMIAGKQGTALKAKLCWGTSDGSTTKEYNLTGSGYKSYAAIPSTSAYISKMDFTNGAIVPTAASGSESTYYCDYVYTKSSAGTYVASCGGHWYDSAYCGSCCFHLNYAASYSNASIGSRSLFI